MNITFDSAQIEKAPKGFVRIRLTEEAKSTSRFVREGEITWIELGAGKRAEMTRRKFMLLVRQIILCAKSEKVKKIAIQFDKTPFPALKSLQPQKVASLVAENLEMANFEFNTFKTKPKEGFAEVEEVLVMGPVTLAMKKGFERGQIIGQEVNECRALANMPGGDMTPTLLAKAAIAATGGTKAKVAVLGRLDMERLSMGAILGVAKGSTEEPKFIVMEYWGAGKGAKKKPLVLVGKGVTFDSGGLNIKTGDHMYEMHLDMSGGAAVIHAVALAAKLNVKRNIIGLIPAVENMPGNEAYRPGDILRSMSGKTIEVLNTDAEGRVILADALTYAKKYDPSLVVEASTLTGASLIALGQHASAVLSKDEKLMNKIKDLGEMSGDLVWPMPLWDEYDHMVEGVFGDIPNIPAVGNSRYAGVIGGGKFLEKFADSYPFAHLDIAPRMTAAPGDHLAKGAAGAPVRLFLAIAENL